MQKPMLCQTGTLNDLSNPKKAGEFKFDGTRVLADRTDTKITVYNRELVDYTRRLTEFVEALEELNCRDIHLDGEAVYFDPATGQVDFTPCQRRCSTSDYGTQLFLKEKFPLKYEVFDIMRLDGEDLTLKPFWQRKALLEKVFARSGLFDQKDTFQFVQPRSDLQCLFEETRKMDEEGIIAKNVDSAYEFNTRSYSWLKIKNWRKVEAHVVGFTPGKNARAFFFGSLVLEKDGKYIGCAGSGFDEFELRKVKDILTSSKEITPPFNISESYTAIETDLRVRVQYYKITKQSGVMREPVFLDIVQ